MPLRCTNCGEENEAGRKFCGECGTPLAAPCPTCGAANPPSVKFCGECGTKLDQGIEVATTPDGDVPRPTTSERRLVSVLFVDLVGFTTLSETRDAEEVRELLSRYFEIARRVIERYGGAVEKFIGDAVMALWGAPVANEDDAERAVRAALELVVAVRALAGDVGAAELDARAGVLTGEAAVNMTATDQGMVAGDLVNTASRIQSTAEPGAVFVGDATRRASEAAIVYEDAGQHELKGKADPVALFRAVRVVAAIGGEQRATVLEPPFVGRDRELRMIKDLFHTSAEGGRAQLVTVLGAAGLGKSRLAWEFFKYIDGLAVDTRWHRGRCLAYGEGVTYWALAEMVRTNASIIEGEGPDTALPKVRAAVEAATEDQEERRWLEPRLASLLGLESGPSRDREDLFAAWRFFYERLANEMPTVMVFEDLHWADPSLLDFIEYLVEWSREFPLFVLALGRPDVLERRSNWGVGGRASTTIHLDPLEPQAMEHMLQALVPGLPEEVEDRLLERAEGVPLYAVETLRMLIDRGLLEQEGAVFRPTGPVDELEVPETLHALIAARLDGLTAEERTLVQDAAVLGKTFTPGALADVSDLGTAEVDEALASLVRKEIFTVLSDRFSPDRGQYTFLGDLIRWVAYETLPKRARRARHLAVADYMERQFDEDDVIEVVAAHLVQAVEEATDAPDAAEVRERAREATARAAERARSLGAATESRRYLEQAIGLTDDETSRAELRERAGRAALAVGAFEAADEHFRTAIELFSEHGHTHSAARASVGLGEVDRAAGRSEEGLARLEAAFEILEDEPPDASLAMLAAQLGRFLFFADRFDEALERIELALTWAERLREPQALAEGFNTKALILAQLGRPEEAVLLLRHSLTLALDHDLGPSAMRAYNNLISYVARVDRHEEELQLTTEALEYARRLGDRLWELTMIACTINPLVFTGRWEDAIAASQEILDTPDIDRFASVIQELGTVVPTFIERGDLAGARRVMEVFEATPAEDMQGRLSRVSGRVGIALAEGGAEEAYRLIHEELRGADRIFVMTDAFVVEFSAIVLRVLASSGRYDELERELEHLRALPPGERTPFIELQVTRHEAILAAHRGADADAEAASKRAIGGFREAAMPFWTAVASYEYGAWLVEHGRAPEASPHLVEARAEFDRLGARPWLDRVDAIAPAAAQDVSTPA